ncbi:MAG: ankyrin repeat domain-containing protein [Pseudomonadota bacterium]|nr:ankyrin repeat domain-containing protein [Pseudomonadota bacterium]
MNDLLQKYHEGDLARTDFACNVIGQLQQYGDLSDFPGEIHQRLQKLHIDLNTFMEGEISDASIIQGMAALHLNDRTSQGHSVASRLFSESPNTETLKAILEKATATGESFEYDPQAFKDPKDDATGYFLKRGTVDAVAYWMENTDARFLFKTDTINQIIAQDNVEVLHYLLTHPHDPHYAELKIPEQIIQNPQAMAAAIRCQHLPLLSALLEKGAPLDPKAALALLEKASGVSLMAVKKAQEIDRQVAQAELQEKGKTPEMMSSQLLEEKFNREYRVELREIDTSRKMVDNIIETGNEKTLIDLLSVAISKGHLDPARKIVFKDLSNSPKAIENQKKLLVLAAEKGDLATVQLLVENNSSIIDAKDASGVSALSRACAGNHVEIAKYLIFKGSNVVKDNSAPLYYAAKSGNIELCQRLMDAGATITMKSLVEKNSPIAGVMLSTVPLHKKEELLNLLFNVDSSAKTPLSTEQILLLHEALVVAAKSPKTTIPDIEMIRDNFGINLEKVPYSEDKCIAVHALQANNLTLARELLRIPGLNDHELATQGIHLFYITMKKISDLEKILGSWDNKKQGGYDQVLHQQLEDFLTHLVLDLKVPLEVRTKDGRTPLMLAAEYKMTKFIKLFLEKGACVDKEDQSKNTALHFAASSNDVENMKLIGSRCKALFTQKNQNGELPMHILAQATTTPQAVHYLLGDNQGDTPDDKGNTILHYAVEKDKSLLAVRAMLLQGLDPLQKNDMQPRESALEIVVRKRISAQESGDKSSKQYLGNMVAVLQVISAKALAKDRVVLNKLKPHKEAIIDAYEMYLSHAHANARTPGEKKAVITELDRTIRGDNGVGRLFKTKLRLKEFKIDNAAMLRLKAFKAHLVEGAEIRVEEPKGPRYR